MILMAKIGFLHTSSVHVKTFDNLLSSQNFSGEVVHIVAESLLSNARQFGLNEEIKNDIGGYLQRFENTNLIVCTCTTVGDLAEMIGNEQGRKIMRVDRPLMQAALEQGMRIGVFYTVESTLSPTMALLKTENAKREHLRLITSVFCGGAWPLFESGDLTGYKVCVANWIKKFSAQFDVFVLAQASMAPAADLLSNLTKPILSSPSLAVDFICRLNESS
jgi:hypothetical protein